MAEGKLESQHQIFIVQMLAVFERPRAVQEKLKTDYGIEISLPGVVYYDASTNPALPKKLKTLFTTTRNKFLKDSALIPIASKSWRLRKLQTMFETEENQTGVLQNKKAMRAILEQAAKESGDAFTNRQKHEHTGKDGKDLTPQTITVNIVKSNSIIKDETSDPADAVAE